MENLSFLPINFELHSELCIKFRSDSFICSFGTADPFLEDDGLGSQKYLEWLKSKNCENYGTFHIWRGQQIIGQLELGERKTIDDFGYVNLYYLVPNWRGRGVSYHIDEFAMTFLKRLGYQRARLSVSPSNSRAIKFYIRNGWVDLGTRTDVDKNLKFPLHFMEKCIV